MTRLRSRRLGTVLVAALASVLPHGAPAGAAGQVHPAASSPSQVQHAYAPSADRSAHPERGFSRYSEAHFTADGTGFTPLDPAVLARYRVDDGVSLVFRCYYLDAYRTLDAISPSDLARIGADLAAVRAAGLKTVIRFAYSSSSGADAPLARVLGHVRQLGPVLDADADVIEALQAGFIGRWGEWYYTDHFASDPGAPWALSAQDWDDRRAVLLALLDSTSSSIRVQVRYPAVKQHVFPDGSDARADRVGVHDDCFVASDDDLGTFATPSDRTWLAQQSQSVVVGGETCGTAGARSLWPSASTDLAAYHWTFLNADFDTDVLASWGGAGRAEAARRLGYRLRLTTASLPARASAGAVVPVSLTVTNDGYAAPLQSRPVLLVLRDGCTALTYPLVADTRTWGPGRAVTVSARIRVPVDVGSYTLSLDLPDSSDRLRTAAPTAGGGSTHAAYAVRLANAATWDASTGDNDLGQVLTVTP